VPIPELSRRQFVAAAGGAVASIWLLAEARDLLAAGEHAARATRETPPPPFQVLTADQAAELEAITAQIVPTDNTPGAREARVVYFIDKSLATFAKDQRPGFEKGLKDLRVRAAKARPGAKTYASLTDAQQIAVIAALEKDKSEFFEMVRAATIAGMLSNPEYGGNYNKNGWRMIGFDDRFSWAAPFGWYDRNV
jgi:gluconate 2-dehydrogenase gamma chain